MKHICIEGEDTGHCNDDCFFRSYELSTEGSSREELIDNAVIWEIDQDGGSHDGENIAEYSKEVFDTCVRIIDRYISEAEKS